MTILQTFGRGCAFFDFNNDGWQDILLVAAPHPLLYRNDGKGRFEDVTARSGLAVLNGDWKGVAVGDYDGDGYLDILLVGYHCLALLKNTGQDRFINTTAASGLSPTNHRLWGSSAGFMDLRGAGRLDLVILNYAVFGPHQKQYCQIAPGVLSDCDPGEYRPQRPELWENLGAGRFKDVTASSGLKNTHGKALALAFADVNGDGRPDFYIGNDTVPADLMLNEGALHFKNIGAQSGAALGLRGHGIAAMGADWADYDRDGRPDLAVSAFSNEPYSLLHNVGNAQFINTSDDTGLSGPTYKPLGFGTKWIDVDNDGWPDLIFANGHVDDHADQIDPLSPLRQPMMLFHNQAGKHFKNLAPLLGGDLMKPIMGRGLATGDFDNDGRIDFLAVDYEGAPLLFHNLSQAPAHWITLDLRGAGENRYAYGAQVTCRRGASVWTGMVSPASSYLSSSDPRVHFGLGSATGLDSISVHWSGGRTQLLLHPGIDRILPIQEQAPTRRG